MPPHPQQVQVESDASSDEEEEEAEDEDEEDGGGDDGCSEASAEHLSTVAFEGTAIHLDLFDSAGSWSRAAWRALFADLRERGLCFETFLDEDLPGDLDEEKYEAMGASLEELRGALERWRAEEDPRAEVEGEEDTYSDYEEGSDGDEEVQTVRGAAGAFHVWWCLPAPNQFALLGSGELRLRLACVPAHSRLSSSHICSLAGADGGDGR